MADISTVTLPDNSQYNIKDADLTKWIHQTSSGNPAVLDHPAGGIMLQSCVASGTTTSGISGLTLYVSSKNLADYTLAVAQNANSDIEFVTNGFRTTSKTAGTYRGARIGSTRIGLQQGVTYTLSADVVVTSGRGGLVFRSVDGNVIKQSTGSISSSGHYSVTYTPAEDVYLCFFCTYSSSADGDVTYTNIQLEMSSSETTYEPYRGAIYTVDWSETAGSITTFSYDFVDGTLVSGNNSYSLVGKAVKTVSNLNYFRVDYGSLSVEYFLDFGPGTLYYTRTDNESSGVTIDIGSINDIPLVPTAVSDLDNDLEFQTETEVIGYISAMWVEIGNGPLIYRSPTDQTASDGDKVYFHVDALGYGNASITYQWQYSYDSGTTWADSSFTGNKTATMQVSVTTARNGYQYRCNVTSNGVTKTSSAGTLHVS